VTSEGFVVWFTGLPSSGKTTLARSLEGALRSRGHRVEVLDGDEIRARLSRGLGFSKEDRDENIRRIAYVARLLAGQGVAAITAAISPYREVRDEARREIRRFVEVFVRCPLEVCIARDVKGLYRRALAGEIQDFTGISAPYEEPVRPELVVDTEGEGPEVGLSRVLRTLKSMGCLSHRRRGVTSVPLPTYLVERIQARVKGRPRLDPASYVADVLSEALAHEEAAEGRLAVEERAAIEARLRKLGYID
jgi:adenylylsulfate kinase